MKRALVVGLVSLFGCAFGRPAPGARVPAGADCGEDDSLVARRGASVYAAPDPNSDILAVFADDTKVCASADRTGFNFRRVQLENGESGFVRDSGFLR